MVGTAWQWHTTIIWSLLNHNHNDDDVDDGDDDDTQIKPLILHIYTPHMPW